VLIADEKSYVRSALRFLLEQETSTTVISEASNHAELVTALETGCPNTVLLDWELPGCNITETVRSLRTKCSRLTIIAMSSRPEARRSSLNAGADGFINKGCSPEETVAAIKNITEREKL
jgi:DNA-binding NarL/FixJ family response regulator